MAMLNKQMVNDITTMILLYSYLNTIFMVYGEFYGFCFMDVYGRYKWLVRGDCNHGFVLWLSIQLGIIIPTEELIFSEGLKPPTSRKLCELWINNRSILKNMDLSEDGIRPNLT